LGLDRGKRPVRIQEAIDVSSNSIVRALTAADVVVACADEFASIVGERLLGLTAVQETQVYAVAVLPPSYLFSQFDLCHCHTF
jgi:hypothetical protein